MPVVHVVVIDALRVQLDELAKSDPKIRKLFDKQKQFMGLYHTTILLAVRSSRTYAISTEIRLKKCD